MIDFVLQCISPVWHFSPMRLATARPQLAEPHAVNLPEGDHYEARQFLRGGRDPCRATVAVRLSGGGSRSSPGCWTVVLDDGATA
jgi:hypothetical protein